MFLIAYTITVKRLMVFPCDQSIQSAYCSSSCPRTYSSPPWPLSEPVDSKISTYQNDRCTEVRVLPHSFISIRCGQYMMCVLPLWNKYICNTSLLTVHSLFQLHSRCSGRQTCSFPVTELHGTQAEACPLVNDLSPYLAASYECVKGESI